MYARIVQVPLTPGASTDATTYFQQMLSPVLKEQPGFSKAHFLVDEANNQCMMVTFWESVETRTKAETNGVLKTALADMKPYLAGLPTIGYYEVAVQVA